MRLRQYRVIDGRPVPVWGENDPGGYAIRKGYGGELVTGEPGAVEKQRRAEREFKARSKA